MIEDYDGYLEHASENDLTEPRRNVGKGGYTVFAEIVKKRYGFDFQGKSWCVVFVFAVHPGMFGAPCTGVFTLAKRMIRRGRWRNRKYSPKRGDLIFTRNSAKEIIGHVGVVLEATDGSVKSIEGNTVDPSGIFPPSKGGAVAIRTRKPNDSHIVGYATMRGRTQP